MKAPPPEEHSGEKVPIWIISFADMITLLLSFFVMLQTMAKARDSTLFGIAQDSFRRSIIGCGMPDLLLGRKPATHFDYRKIKYPTDDAPAAEADLPNERIIDAKDEEIRRSFLEMQRIMESASSDAPETVLQTIRPPLLFPGGVTTLDDEGRKQLANLANDLVQNIRDKPIKIYVVAAVEGPVADKMQWFRAARRAEAVKERLRTALGESVTRRWELLSMATAPDSTWCRQPQATVQCPPIAIHIVGRKD